MKKNDLNNETVTRIVESALDLFNVNGYAGTSISMIAEKAQLSKGILYHYFQNKDDLYLHCVKLCIDHYRLYLEQHLHDPSSVSDAVTENIKIRFQFFEKHPQYRTLFNFIISKKPNHLSDELIEIRRPLKESNSSRIKAITADMVLGKGITDNDIVAFTTILQNSFSFLLQENYTEDLKAKQIETVVRITKVFINGLKEDVV